MVTLTDVAAATRLAGPAGPDTGVDRRLRERLRTLLCCLALTVLVTSTRPGEILADTKIDMALDPLGFLGRALHLWDIEQFGQLQNQADGYLFPMGPFYAIGHLVGLPAWITQRMWLAALLCAAFLGARRLAARLGIGTELTRAVAGMVYALGPHGLASLGLNSSEYMPLAALPWIVLPLVGAAEAGASRRGLQACARSALAVACCGGINATATMAVLVVPVVYLLTRPRPVPRIRLLAGWGVAVGLATAWWLVPLLLIGRYAFSWLPYTEQASTTTATTGLVNVLRGAQRWVDALMVDGHAWWPVGHALSVETLPALCTGLLAVLGLVGLVRPRLPERTFLTLTVLAGLAIMAAGHTSVIESPLAPAVRHLIDGPLAPLRNLYKFDGLVRLPLALAVAHLLASVRLPGRGLAGGGDRRPRRSEWLKPVLPIACVVVALAGIVAPALTNGLSGTGTFRHVPAYWRAAADWLNGRAGKQGVIAVPGSRFGEYTWGRPMDEVMQPLLHVRWGVRQLVPSGSPGYTRLLDAIDRRVATGQGSAGLGDLLARMGVRYILVRNDLRRDELRGAWPARVHQALTDSPGIHKVRSFGVDTPVGGRFPNDAVNLFDQPYPPLEIYEVSDSEPIVSLTDASRALRLYGSPEALLTMADNGLLDGRPMLLDDDATGATGTPVVADSLRLVRRNFGEIRTQISPTVTAAEQPHLSDEDRDLLEPGWSDYSTVASYSGIENITASTSAADIDSIAAFNDPGDLPYAAVDGNPWTTWETGGRDGPVGQWLKIEFAESVEPDDVTAAFSQNPLLGPPPAEIAVETETGRIEQRLRRTSEAQPLAVPHGRTRWLRIKVLGLAWKPTVAFAARVAISELRVPGVHAVRHYRLPSPPTGDRPATVVMARSPGEASACMHGSIRWVCSSSLKRRDEEGQGFDRIFSSPVTVPARLSGTAVLTDSKLVQRYTNPRAVTTVRASSALSQAPQDQARSAFDGDYETAWIASPRDRRPRYSMSWRHRVKVGSVMIRRPPGARGPLRVRVEGANGQWREGTLDRSGRLRFKPMRTDRLTLRFTATARADPQPLQISEITVPGVEPLRTSPETKLRLRCGLGPNLKINGHLVRTKATGTYGDVLAGRPLRFQACEPVTMAAGDSHLASVPFDAFRIESAIVDPGGALATASPGRPTPVTVTEWTKENRTVDVDARRTSYLTVNENYNDGWRAEIDGRTLRPVRVDGWRQAWVVPAGTAGTVRITYAPDPAYRAALFVGLNLLLVLVFAVLWPVRRPRPPRRRRTRERGVPMAARRTVVVLLAAALGFWVGGSVGCAVAVAVAVSAGWALPRVRARRALILAGSMAGAMAAGTVSLVVGMRLRAAGAPEPVAEAFGDVVPQLLGLVVVALLVTTLFGLGGVSDVRDASRAAPGGDGRAPPRRR